MSGRKSTRLPLKRQLPASFEADSRRRKTNKAKATTAEEDDEVVVIEPKKAGMEKKRTAKARDPPEEKRLRRFRPKPPQTFSVIFERATSQRFYVLNRSRRGTHECPEETVEMAGSTGNVYYIHISQVPSCTCPHFEKGNQCKHIIYVMFRVLRARFDLVYQLALLSAELREIFSHAPAIEITDDEDLAKKREKEREEQEVDEKRKPIEGDCPICFTPFEGRKDTVYCRAQCGQNMHKECFKMWAAAKRSGTRGQVPCPMCRTPWQDVDDDDDGVANKIRNTGIPGDEGYVNVADQLGISRVRDDSTYYRRARQRGWF